MLLLQLPTPACRWTMLRVQGAQSPLLHLWGCQLCSEHCSLTGVGRQFGFDELSRAILISDRRLALLLLQEVAGVGVGVEAECLAPDWIKLLTYFFCSFSEGTAFCSAPCILVSGLVSSALYSVSPAFSHPRNGSLNACLSPPRGTTGGDLRAFQLRR